MHHEDVAVKKMSLLSRWRKRLVLVGLSSIRVSGLSGRIDECSRSRTTAIRPGKIL
jgi:hypothetical protein